MIFAFDQTHPIGFICRFPCPMCGDNPKYDDASRLTDGHGGVPVLAMMIVREATRQEWRDFCAEMKVTLQGEPPASAKFYEVSTD